MNIINLTKHAINIYDENGNEIVVIPPSGLEARIKTDFDLCGMVKHNNSLVPIYKTVIIGTPHCVDDDGNECPLPESRPNTIYVVSGLFRASFDRPDLWQPGKLLRNDAGQPIGCIGLSK